MTDQTESIHLCVNRRRTSGKKYHQIITHQKCLKRDLSHRTRQTEECSQEEL